MIRKEYIDLIACGLLPKVNASFSANDANDAAINAIKEACGFSDSATIKELSRDPRAFALIEEAIDRELPIALGNIVGEYAEIKTYARDEEVIFDIKDLGRHRAKLSISKGARGGIYKARRLDSAHFQMPTEVYTVGMYVTLEDILLGTYSLADLYNNILDGFQEIIYKETMKALTSASAAAGGTRIQVASGSTSSLEAALLDVIPKVKQYGIPTIFGFYGKLSSLTNGFVYKTSGYGISEEDKNDIRNQGYVNLWHGIRVVEFPDYLVDENNDTWAYNSYHDYIYVIPAGARPVKVALKGDTTLIENRQAVGSEKWEAHKLMGVGVAMANNFTVLDASTSTAITSK